MTRQKLMLIDGNSILNRAFFGVQSPKLLQTSEGLYTNAVYGFINIITKYIQEENPDYIGVAFDLKAPTFRHLEYDKYKGTRKGMPSELAVQVPVVKEVLDAMNIKRLELEGYEADDILGALSLCGENKGMEVVLVTGDKDSFQLVSESTRIKYPVTKLGKTETEEYDFNKIIEKYGIQPTQFIDLKGLMGDSSDNIPGVPGIGEKTALDLIKAFHDLDNLYENICNIEKKSLKEKLEQNKELAYLSRKLATVVRDVPLSCDIGDLKRKEYNHQALFDVFNKLEFKSLIEKFNFKQVDLSENIEESVETEIISSIEGLRSLREKIEEKGSFSIYYVLESRSSTHNRLAGLSICVEGSKPAFVDMYDGMGEYTFLKEFKSIIEDENIKKFGHDIKSFIVFLKNNDIDFKGLSFDTMIGAYILDPARASYAIDSLAKEYLNISIKQIEALTGKGKNYTSPLELPKETISQLAGTNASVIMRLANHLNKIIAENQQKELYYDIELPLITVLADMEYYGFRVDMAKLKEFSLELQEKIGHIEKEIYQLAGEEFNINSTKQLGVILFERLGLPAVKKTKTGYSTDAEVLEQLAPQHEIIHYLLEYRQLVKLYSTYAEGLLAVIDSYTGKIHSSFNQTVTVTGRISSTEPNLQNIPIKSEMGRKIRKVFVPSDSNFVLLDADYSQIELRVLAHITGDPNMIAAFENNEDIHTATAAKVFGVSREEMTPLLRSRAKAVNFGIVYGIGDFSLSRDLGITRKEARKYIDEYLENFSNVRKYMHDIVEQGKQQGYVSTIFNRRRYLPELKSSNFTIRSFGERIAMNTPIQGSAADIIKIAMVKVHSALKAKSLKSRVILQVHDELLIETFVDEKDIVTRIMKESMESAVKLAVPLKVDVNCGLNWYDVK